MKSPIFENCPSCDKELQPIPAGRANIVAECDSCGFIATIRDEARADYLANICEFPDVRLTAERIAARKPLSPLRLAMLSSTATVKAS